MKHKDFEVSIIVDGVPVEEFGTRIENDGFVSCFIPSQIGKQFTITLSNFSMNDALMRSLMDGRLVDSVVLRTGTKCTVEGVRISKLEFRPFVFAPIKLTDDDSILNSANKKQAEALGIIEVHVLRIAINGPIPTAPVTFDDQDVGPVHERSKKTGGHCVSFAPPRKLNWGDNFVSTTKIDPEDKPLVKFRFTYRPRDILQAQEIIPPKKRPRQSSSSDLTHTAKRRATGENGEGSQEDVKPVINDMPTQGLSALKSQRDAMQAQMTQLERRIAEAEGSGIQAKREPSPIHLKHKVDDIIDLTLD